MLTTGGPGGCKNENECRSYCSDPSHAEECVAFGAAHGGLPEEEVRKMLKEFQENRFEVSAQIGGEFHRPEDFHKFREEAEKRFQEFRALEEQFRGQSFPAGGPGFSDFGHSQGQGGGFGNAGQPAAFAGPGGCTSPAECIKYCAEHKEECFQSGPSAGTPGREGGFAPGREFGPPPQLRSNLVIEFDNRELPEGFGQKSEEEKKQFFQQKFNEIHGFSGEHGQLPGRPGQFEGSRQFPGGPEQFPGRPEKFPGKPGEFPGSSEGFRPPEGFHQEEFQRQLPEGFRPPEGSFPGQPPQNFPHPEGTFQRPPEGSSPPPNFIPPSSGSFEHQSSPPPPPSGGFEQQSPPPPSGGSVPPPPPSSSIKNGFFASIIDFFTGR